MRRRSPITLLLALGLLLGAARAQDAAMPQLVEVTWQTTKSLYAPGVSNAVSLNDQAVAVQVLPDRVQFSGLARGQETVVFLWRGERRDSVLVRVVDPPDVAPSPSLRNGFSELAGHGFVSTSMQTTTGSAGGASFYLGHAFSWEQPMGDGRKLFIQAQAFDLAPFVTGSHSFNLNTFTVQYTTPTKSITVGDFLANLNGGASGRLGPYGVNTTFLFRGAEYSFERGRNNYQFFGGVTQQPFFFSVYGARDIAGFNFTRHQSDKMTVFATSAFTSVPVRFANGSTERAQSFFQTAGLVYQFNKQWSAQAAVGASSRGFMAQGGVAYTGQKLTGFVTALRSSPDFPMNQMQLFYAGNSSIVGGGTYTFSPRLSTSLYFQHLQSGRSLTGQLPSTADYLSPGIAFALTQRQLFTVSYSYTRSAGTLGLASHSTGSRLNVAWNSTFGRFANTADVSMGSVADPLQTNSSSDFLIHDGLQFRTRFATFNFGFQHQRTDPTLINRLRQEVGLLSPALQLWFANDPLGFVQSGSLPPELRALLNSLTPASTQISAAAQFSIGKKLSISPNYSYSRYTQGSDLSNGNHFGYTLTYAIRPTLTLQSSLSDAVVWNTRTLAPQHTTIFSIGLQKRLNGMPAWVVPTHRSYTIVGRVFRDNNVNGAYNEGEPGLAGLTVKLGDHQTAITDADGRFEFRGLERGSYRVTLPLEQFTERIRVTNATDVAVEVADHKTPGIAFGVVNFARIMGSVYNDYLLDGSHQGDAPGVHNVALELASADFHRTLLADANGEFELYDVPPGDYQLTVDPATLPAKYVAAGSVRVHIDPVSTVLPQVPVRALRSIAGRVYFQGPRLAENGNPGCRRDDGNGNGGTGNGRVPISDASTAHAENGNGNGNGNGQCRNDGNGNGAAGMKLRGIPKKLKGKAENGNGNGNGNAQAAPASELQPLAGVKLSVAGQVVETDANGYFVFRDLPAGALTVEIMPRQPLPAGVVAPNGKVVLPKDPVDVETARIIITKQELLPYLLAAPAPKPARP